MPDFESMHMIEAMRSGVSSREVGRCFSDARKPLLKKIDENLDAACSEGLSKGMVVSGKYGEGKTHLLQTVFSMAHERNMVVSMVPIGKENPLDKLYLFYQKIMASTYLPGHEQPGVISELDKISPLSKIASDLLLFTATELSSQRLHYLMDAYLHSEQKEQKYLLQADLEGDFISNSTIREMYSSFCHKKCGKFSFVKTQNYIDYFAFMSRLFKELGYRGWVLLFDEAELMGRYSRRARCKAYRNMNYFLNPPSGVDGMFSLFVFSSSYREDVIIDRNEKMEIEKYFQETSDCTVIPSMIDQISNAEELKSLSNDEINDVIDNIRRLHSKAYGWSPEISTDKLFSLTASHNYVLRTRLRSVIEYLDQLYQYGTIGENTVAEIHDQSIKEEQDAEVLDGLMP